MAARSELSPVAFLRANASGIVFWLIVIGSLLVGYASFVFRWDGFASQDSRFYLAMAYHFGGESKESAFQLTQEYMQRYGYSMPDIEQLFGWGLVQPRVLLPVLAIIPVKLFGPMGLAGVVLVLNIALTTTLAWLLRWRFGATTALAVILLINSSYFLQLFRGLMLTESFSALWTLLSLLAAWAWIEKRKRISLVLLVLTVLGAAFTRQATFIVAGAFVMAWLLGSLVERRNSPWMWPALLTAATSLGAQIFQTLVFPSFSQADQFMEMTGTDSLSGAIGQIPRMILQILTGELYAFLQSDISLLIFILLAVASMIIFYRNERSHLLFGAILGVALYNITNGSTTQFRYAIPGLVFYALSAATLIRFTEGKVRGERSLEVATAAELDSAAPSAQGHSSVK